MYPMDFLKLQPADRVDYLTEDGEELTQRPYPFHATQSGEILDPIHRERNLTHVIGFVDDPSTDTITLWWGQAWKNPTQALGRYIVTRQADDGLATHILAVASTAWGHKPDPA